MSRDAKDYPLASLGLTQSEWRCRLALAGGFRLIDSPESVDSTRRSALRGAVGTHG